MTLRDQILEIRDSGGVNMFDSPGVQALADRLGYLDLVLFIQDHREEYHRFILSGDEGLLAC